MISSASKGVLSRHSFAFLTPGSGLRSRARLCLASTRNPNQTGARAGRGPAPGPGERAFLRPPTSTSSSAGFSMRMRSGRTWWSASRRRGGLTGLRPRCVEVSRGPRREGHINQLHRRGRSLADPSSPLHRRTGRETRTSQFPVDGRGRFRAGREPSPRLTSLTCASTRDASGSRTADREVDRRERAPRRDRLPDDCGLSPSLRRLRRDVAGDSAILPYAPGLISRRAAAPSALDARSGKSWVALTGGGTRPRYRLGSRRVVSASLRARRRSDSKTSRVSSTVSNDERPTCDGTFAPLGDVRNGGNTTIDSRRTPADAVYLFESQSDPLVNDPHSLR
jgi:hypothetical protein